MSGAGTVIVLSRAGSALFTAGSTGFSGSSGCAGSSEPGEPDEPDEPDEPVILFIAKYVYEQA